MIEPIEFDTFLKIVGGTSIVSLATQIFSIFNISLEIEKKRKSLIEKPKKDNFGQDIEYSVKEQPVIEQSVNIKWHLTNLLYGFVIAVISILTYSITNKISYLRTEEWYIIIVSLISYVFLLVVPLYVTYHMYKIFRIYYDISIVSLNNPNKDDKILQK